MVVVLPSLLAVGPASSSPAGTTGVASHAPGSFALDAARSAVAPAYHPENGAAVVGPLPTGTPLDVAVGLLPSDPTGLSATLDSLYAAGSPEWGRFLSPTTVHERFGPSAAEVRAATAYFETFGLDVRASSNGLLLQVAGPSGQIGAAFSTTFEEYRSASGTPFYDHPTAATLPTGVGWGGIVGLDSVASVVPADRSSTAERPLVGPAATCTPGAAGLSPCQVVGAYSYVSLLGNGTNGTGERIGIVDAYSGSEPQVQLASDYVSFSGQFGLPTGGLSFLYPVPTSQDLNLSTVNPDWGLEEALDVEWAHAAAPGASVDLAFSPNAGAGLYEAIDALVGSGSVNVLSLSWGEPDTGVFNSAVTPCAFACNASTDGTYALLDPVLEFAAAEGISVFAASGDCGAADGTSSVATNYPASDPFVTGVGGTVLSVSNGGAYLSETAWSGNASGSTAPGCVNQGGSGGGYAPFPRPWWQSGPAVGVTHRGVPDVALDAGTPVSIVIGGRNGGVLGTSVATPIWAGIAAVADQRATRSLGFLDPSLYRVASGPNASADFHDIVSGTNGYPAGPGWDPVTGLGSPVVANLVRDLTATPTLTGAGPRTFLFASPRFGPAPLTVDFGLTASGGTGSFPLEDIDFGDGNASVVRALVSPHTFDTPGVYSATGWVVDSSGNTSVTPPIVIVVGGGTSLSVSLVASSLTPAVGAPVTFDAQVAGGTAPYRYSFAFGDGTYDTNVSSAGVVHAFGAPGGYCASVVVADAATPPNGGASSRLAVSAGGARTPSCGNDSVPLALQPVAVGVRDAPADFPALFSVTGGSTPPFGLSTSVAYSTNDTYLAACGCAIFRGPGSYTVRGWANDTVNQEATGVTNVTVAPFLRVAFAVSVNSGPAPLRVEFFAAARGGDGADANRTVWTFGDGHTAVGHTVNETFALPGEYLAVGSLSDAGHGNASEAFLLDVLPPGPLRGTGIVGTVTPAVNISSGTTVRFTAGLVGPAPPIPLLVEWNLGTGRSAFGPGANQTYFGPFPAPGANALTGSVSAVLPNTVPVLTVPFTLAPFFAVEAGGFVPSASAISLSSAVAPTLGLTPFPVTGTSTAAAPGGASVQWFFGDGSNSVGNSVGHTYYASGNYTVRAVARDPFFDTAVDSTALVANGPLQVFGGPTPASGVPPLSITFAVLGVGGTGPPYSYHWTFEGGRAVNGTTVTVDYPSLGRFWASVNVTDSSGQSVVRNWTVDLHPPPALDAAEIVALSSGVGVLAAVVQHEGWLRRRPGRPTLSQRRAAEAVRRVV